MVIKKKPIRKTAVVKRKPLTKKIVTRKTIARKIITRKPVERKTVVKPAIEKKYKHPRNMALVEKLDEIERNSMDRKTEQACYVEKKTGKCLFCVNGTKNSVTPNAKQIDIIHKRGKDLIVTHNHPYPYNSSITDADLSVCINNDSAGVRAITHKWTYVLFRPDDGWKCTWYEAQKVYNDIFKQVEKKYNALYQADKMTKSYYEDNLTHEVMEKVSKKLGFKYFRFRN